MSGMFRKTSFGVAAFAVAAFMVAMGAAPAGADPTTVCSGTLQAPGTLVGTISGNVTISGACAVDAGRAVVTGDLEVSRGSTLVAAFGSHDSNLTVGGNFIVDDGATAVIGCNPVSSPCVDDNPEHPILTSSDSIKGNFTATGALGVIVHNTAIVGSVFQQGGGGGFTCNSSPGVFTLFQSPVFSTFEDGSVGGSVIVSGVSSCWMGMARMHVGGNVFYSHNRLADPDAIEIVLNTIQGNLSCQSNSMTWDSGDLTNNLYPRAPQPNTVVGTRSGQCVLASPAVQGGPPGPGPF
ncbi:MAG TPA: hypothetical protein VKR23_09320 [Gaiellaceae bacterium]|nr:hypothetical protein [Gaiellaceae bacterium]